MTSSTDLPAQPPANASSDERSDLLHALHAHRGFLRVTVRGLTDEQARRRTTVSELCLGGLVKHVAATEAQWVEFALHGPQAFAQAGDGWADGFRLTADETLGQVLEEYDRVAARTDQLVVDLPDLDVTRPLPEAPWFPPGASWSIRRVLLHIIAETAQHAGHADVLRESLDGQKTMG